VSRAKDGYFQHCILGNWHTLIGWLAESDSAADLAQSEWENPIYRRENCEHIFDVLDLWVERVGFTVDELVQEAQKRRFGYAPIQPPESLSDLQHLQERGFWVDVHHPELGRKLTYPGAPYHFSESPWDIRRRAPLLGEDNETVFLSELGLSNSEFAQLIAQGTVRSATDRAS
jgi:crotonobetainyl-CoA:carnitine CoA-transferase CaiB-like acyl-CoA transferase